jgi:hypothetical protein
MYKIKNSIQNIKEELKKDMEYQKMNQAEFLETKSPFSQTNKQINKKTQWKAIQVD